MKMIKRFKGIIKNSTRMKLLLSSVRNMRVKQHWYSGMVDTIITENGNKFEIVPKDARYYYVYQIFGG